MMFHFACCFGGGAIMAQTPLSGGDSFFFSLSTNLVCLDEVV